MRNEEETRDFYLDAVQKVVDEKARLMFEELPRKKSYNEDCRRYTRH